LSFDSGDRTTFLLEQMSRQLGGFENGTYPPFQDPSPFPRSRSILWVNILWFLSLVTSIVSGFYAMLVQQWVGRYNQICQELPRNQRRARVFLLRGAQKYSLSTAIGVMPILILLNISLFLFLFGLILFLFTISHVLATMVAVCTGLFGLPYFALTILPIIHGFCPYFTPMSGVCWYMWHISLSTVAFALRWIVGQFCADSLPRPLNNGGSLGQGTLLIKLSRGFRHAFRKHTQRVKDGLRWSIIRQALEVPLAEDLKGFTWLLQRLAMADNSKIQEFVDSIPGETLLQLSYIRVPADSEQMTIHKHLSNLFQSCISTQGTTELKEDARSRRLLVCLDAFHHIVESSPIPNGFSLSDMALEPVWSIFKDVELVRRLWNDNDTAVCVTSRSICTHLARQLLRKHSLDKPEQTWLQEIIGDPTNETYSSDRVAMAERRNLMSFVYDVLSNRTDKLDVKSTTRFAESLAVLMNAGRSAALSREVFEGELAYLLGQIESNDHRDRDEVVAKLREMFLPVDPHQIVERN